MNMTTEKTAWKRAGWKILMTGAALAALSGTAAARDNVSLSISLGAPIYAPPPAAYIYERPVFYSAPPVIYAAPRVVYYPAPYYAPAPQWRGGHHRGYKNGHQHHGWR